MNGVSTSGLCACGCERPTPIAKKTRTRLGHVKGQPVPYIHGHGACPPGSSHPRFNESGRSPRPDGYVAVRAPGHPRANSWGFVLEHILVAEKALGRPLPDGVQVHHFNEDRADNRGRNLVICPDQAYHALLHRRAAERRASL